MRNFDLKVLLILSLGHLVVDIYQGALPAILPFLKEKLDLTYAMTGMILMASNFTSSILQPVFGYVSDKKAMAYLLPLGLVAAGVGFSVLPFSPYFLLILGLVIISGLGVASYHPEGYKTAHFFTGDRPATGMSVFSVGGNVGFSLGPILSMYIIDLYGFPWLPVIVVPSLLCAAVIVAYRRTIMVPVAVHGEAARREAPKTSSVEYIALAMVILIVVMRSWTQIGLMTYIPFYYIDYLKVDPLYAGKLVFVFLFCGAVGTLLGAPIADRFGHRFFVRLSMFLSTVTLPVMFLPAVEQSPFLFVVLGVQGMLLVSTFSVTIVMAQKLLPTKLGIASGLMVGFAIGTGGVGVTILGLVADHYGVPVALYSISVLPALGFILSMFLRYDD
ncbi:MAG: MFS transporter [Syntrophorhabdus sp.]|nr:MFS transporter [Syntrophorhabdus sp.]